MKKSILAIMASLFVVFASVNAQSFKMQVEKSDGTIITLPADFVKQVTFIPAETYSITYSLNGVTSSNNETSISEGMPYSTNLIVDDNYYISSVNILMNGYDVTSTSYSEGTIKIKEVTGNIIITATALPYSEGVDLSAQGMANCYIVSESGKYKFSITGYNGSKAFLLWNENGVNDITEVELSGNYIYFQKNEFQKGNAVISLADAEGTIVWSWHIWSTDKPNAIEVNGQKWLDRNLGATSTEPNNPDVYGLRYNPGNPFPFPGPKYSSFSITETPSVPEGWYVAEGYGFYSSSKMPGPATPMMLCNRTDVFGNSVYFRTGYSQCPIGYYLPSASTFQNLLGFEPTITDYGVWVNDNLYIPCNEPNGTNGRYLCSGIYNSTAVDTWIISFYEGVSKKTYCQGAALLPIRCMNYSY
jgi:hypothetical protein